MTVVRYYWCSDMYDDCGHMFNRTGIIIDDDSYVICLIALVI